MAEVSRTDDTVTLKQITINKVTVRDLRAAFAAGISDFAKAPAMGLFFGGIYALGGLFVVYALARLNAAYWVIPAAVGFPLLGPFVAVGLYEISRRLEAGTPLTWRGVLFVMLESRKREVSWMAFVVLFVFWLWMYQVRLWLAIFLGFRSFTSVGDFAATVVTTSDGIGFLIVGSAVGAAFASALFSLTVRSPAGGAINTASSEMGHFKTDLNHRRILLMLHPFGRAKPLRLKASRWLVTYWVIYLTT